MTRSFPSGDMRVSDAERDVALAELSEHFQAGRLTHDEFDERSGRALTARTGNDLRELFTDLPDPKAPAPAPQTPAAAPGPDPVPSAARGHLPLGRVVIMCVIASIIIGNVTAAFGNGTGRVDFGWIFPVVILLVVLRRFRR